MMPVLGETMDRGGKQNACDNQVVERERLQKTAERVRCWPFVAFKMDQGELNNRTWLTAAWAPSSSPSCKQQTACSGPQRDVR